MQKSLFKDYCNKRGFLETAYEKGRQDLLKLESFAIKNGHTLDTISLELLKSYISQLIADKKNDRDTLLMFARYYQLIDNKDIYLYFTALFGSVGVIGSIIKRIETTEPEKSSFFSDYEEAPLGLDTELMPSYTNEFMTLLEKHLDSTKINQVLAGNNHQIPESSMEKEKTFYQNSPSIDIYLKERHERKIQELTTYMNINEVWFEQIITKPVIDYVASNQEILSAVHKDGALYVTKIPFDTKAFLEAKTDDEKRYYACHCPFVRENIKNKTTDINPNWCYCSAGFAKFPFEIILEKELTVVLLESPLKGDLQCRFKITLPQAQ